MTEPSSRFSLFLTPCKDDLVSLAAVIHELADACGVPPFEPHVTVHTGDLSDSGLLQRAMTAAVKEVEPFFLRVTGIGCSQEYFKSLFLEFEESAVLRAIHERMKGELGEDSGYRLVPHLSLLYSDMPLGKKEELARGVVLERGDILFDRVKVVSPANGRQGWREPGGWQTLFALKLGGACRCGQ